MDPLDSSDEEDVFECGRCREKFTSLEGFMEHKNNRVCRKAKQESSQATDSKTVDASGAPAVGAETNLQDSSEVFQNKTDGHQPMDLTAGDNIIMAASIASGIDDLAAVAGLECHRQEGDVASGLAVASESSQQENTSTLPNTQQNGGDISSLAAQQENSTTLTNTQQNGGDISSLAVQQENSTTLTNTQQNGGDISSLAAQQENSTTLPNAQQNRGDITSLAAQHENSSSLSNTQQNGSDITSLAAQQENSSTLPNTQQNGGDITSLAAQQENSSSLPNTQQNGGDITSLAAQQENSSSLPNTQQNRGDIVMPRVPEESSTSAGGEIVSEKLSEEAGRPDEENDSEIVEISLAAFNIKCSFCSSVFTNHTSLKEHFADTHKISNEQEVNKLVQEIEKAIQKKKLPVKKSPGRPRGRKRLPTDCSLCGKVFTTRKNFLKHNKSKHHLARLQQQYIVEAQGKRLKKCNNCSFTASSGKGLTDHIRKEHSIFATDTASEQGVPKKRGRGRPRKMRPARSNDSEGNELEACSECGKELKKKLLPVHIIRCQAKKVLSKCSECGKTVVKKALYRHQRRCLNKKHLICPLCQHQSRERYDFTVHVNNHKTWLPAEPGDLPPRQEEPAAAMEQEEQGNVDRQAQDLAGQSTAEDVKQQVEEVETHDTIQTLDLSVLGLTPTPTAPLVIQDQDVSGSLGGSEVQQMANQFPADVKQDTAMDISQNNPLPSSASINFAAGEGEVQRNHKQKQLKCHSCENWFLRSNFKHHMFAVHNLVKKFKCRVDSCMLASTIVDDFVSHVKSHGDHPSFMCGCRSCLIRNANTDNPDHINMLKKQKLKEYYQGMIYKCNKCWVKFPSAEGLERHNKKETHSHPCPTCGKVQVSKRQLRMHAVTHADERNYLCEECGASFKTKRDLNKHHMSHSEFKPFICQDCGKGFLFKNKLVRHRMTVHSNEKPFKCTVQNCDKAFSRRDKLNDHARTHLYYEPFHCRFCPKGFFRKDNLKDHEVLHTKDYRFKCERCPKGFMRPKLLARHIAHEHSMPDSYAENNPDAVDQVGQQLVPLKLTKPKSKSRSRSKKSLSATEAQAQNLTSQITYMIYQQAGSSMAAALQQAMQSVNAGADGCPVTLPPEVLQAYHISQHGKDQQQTYQVTPVVGAEEQISPDSLHDRAEFRLA